MERSKKGAKNNRCCQGVRHRSSVVSRLWKSFKTTGMCSRRHGGGRVKVRRLQKTDISSYQQKEQAHHSSAGGKSVSLLPQGKQISRKLLPELLRGGGLYARRPVVYVPLTRRQHRTARCNGVIRHLLD
ncbi:hypothetical protein TNCV_4664161 [Trichonephila clavipes]|nr:hypothetical protein TNCV_4664161 [Trichonephila clavipes]